MNVFNKKKIENNLSRNKSLQCVPVKNIEVRETRLESGNIMIEYPLRLMRPWLASLIKRFSSSVDSYPTKKIQLDILGTSVWELIDGHRPVHEIIQTFSKIYKLDYKEAEVSVTMFIRDIGQRGLIGLMNLSEK